MTNRLNRLDKAFAAVFEGMLAKPIWTLVGSMVLLGLALFQIRHLNVEVDLYGREVPGFPTTVDYQEQRSRYEDANQVLLLFSVEKTGRGLKRSEACEIHKWIKKQQRENSELASVGSVFSLRTPQRDGDKLWYPHYLNFRCDDAGADPEESVASELEKMRETPWSHSLTGGTDIGAEFIFRDSLDGGRFGRFDPAPVKDLLASAKAELTGPAKAIEVFMVGPSAFQTHLKDAIKRDFLIQGLVFLLIFVVFRWAFGTWRAGFFFLASLVVNLTFIYAAMALVGHPLDLLTNNLLLMTAIAGIEDFIFVSMWMRLSNYTWREATRRMIVPCLFTTLTTAVGFMSLLTSDVEMVGRFGLWAGWAVIVEWVVWFFIFPSLFQVLGRHANWIDLKRADSLDWVVRLGEFKVPRKAFALSLILFALGFYGFKHLNINEEPVKNFPATHFNTVSYDYLERTRGWEGAMTLVFDDPDVRARDGEIRRILQETERDVNVAGVFSPYAILDFMTRGFDELWSHSIRVEILGTPVLKRFFGVRDQVRAVVYFKKADLESMKETVERLTKLCPDGFCRFTGQSAIYLEYTEKIIPTLLESFAVSLVIVAIILAILAWMAEVQGIFAIIYSAMWGPVAMMALIALFQVPVSIITSLFAATIVGLTGDNAIQYIFAAEKQNLHKGIRANAAASVLLGLMLAVCSAVFLLESVKPLKILGVLFVIGFAVNLVGDLWLLKAVLKEPIGNQPAKE